MSLRTLNVIKENHLGEAVFCWEGELLASTPASRTLRALFVGEGAARVDKILFVPGDLMIERYYSNRWYNIFELRQGSSRLVKCWYINLSRPARFEQTSIRWQDLALDLIVYPNGKYRLLDEDAFDELPIPSDEKTRCLETVRKILSEPELIKPGLVFQPGRFPKRLA